MVQLVLVLLLLAGVPGPAQALNLRYGEKDFSLYHDATEPVYTKNVLTGQVFWRDQAYLEDYFFFHSDKQLLGLSHSVLEEIYLGAACTQEQLDKNFDYLRYAHRLVVLSYLLEISENLDTVARKMMLGGICANNWDEVIKKCTPQSDYMKSFLKNSKFVTSQIRPTRVSAEESGKRFIDGWLAQFKKREDVQVSHAALRSYCKQHKCQSLSGEGLKENFTKLCQSNRQLFQSVCSENDQLYGVSYVPEMFELVGRSNILNLLDPSINAQGCLRMFSTVSGQLEKKNEFLDTVIPMMYSHFMQESGYLQGRLFPAGALMEFNVKGLAQVFEEVKKIEAPKPVPKKEEIKKIEDKTVVTKVNAPPPKKPEVPKPVVVVEERPKEIPKSAFLLAAEFRSKYDLDKAKVDMLKFKYDYIFTLERSKKLEQSLELFMQRASIEEMHKMDGLGGEKAPVPLVFIKFMIDKEKHQGLFNLVGVLGNEFYVQNNIDQAALNTSSYVQLINDESTSNQWQINILKK